MYYRPHNKKELFNLWHTLACDIIEQIFGVLKCKFQILQLALEYSIDIQTWIPVILATIYNFICDQQPEKDGEDGNEDEDDLQLISRWVDVDDNEAEQNEGLVRIMRGEIRLQERCGPNIWQSMFVVEFPCQRLIYKHF